MFWCKGLRGRGKGRLVRSEKHVSEDDEEETVQQDVVAIAPTNVPQILQRKLLNAQFFT